jgi:hypothetical protein
LYLRAFLSVTCTLRELVEGWRSRLSRSLGNDRMRSFVEDLDDPEDRDLDDDFLRELFDLLLLR